MLKKELPYGEDSIGERVKPSNRRVVCECNFCLKTYDIMYRDYLKKIDKYQETPCMSCLQVNRQLGKTLEERWGIEKAKEAKEVIRLLQVGNVLGD